jgi:hypothetical protein
MEMKYDRVYIFNIPNVVTGGPEALFQLSHEMIEMGIDCRTYFLGESDDPIASEFKGYKCNVTKEIDINDRFLYIIPEVATSLIKHPHFANANMAIWWLSVDNNGGSFSSDDFRNSKVLHLYQSNYALDFLKKNKVEKPIMLFEPINSTYLGQIDFKKENMVCYSVKGEALALSLKKQLPDYEFIMLKGMSRDQVKSTLSRSKVFIDFGHHPGRDRIPRESVMLGNCLITSKKGSAAFFSDVAIPDRFKFYADEVSKIKRTISECVEDYDSVKKEFDLFRQIILNEKNRFLQNIRELMGLEDA